MMFGQRVLDGEITIDGQLDHICSEVVGNWGLGCGVGLGAEISTAMLCQWRAKYGGMDTSMTKRIKK